ncbi:hypothetical protein EV426DRAFT_617281 [Tirmania nivea]|nr:hypothetical protein EV426DRAFT_617281 [Tirmania nivea]
MVSMGQELMVVTSFMALFAPWPSLSSTASYLKSTKYLLACLLTGITDKLNQNSVVDPTRLVGRLYGDQWSQK